MRDGKRLRKENLQALRPFLRPKIRMILKTPRPGPSPFKVVGDASEETANLLSGNGSLYRPDAVTFARNQVAAYEKNPTRILFKSVSVRDDNEPVENFIVSLHGQTRDIERQETASSFGGYLVSVGCGLGFHLPLLLDRFDCRHLIIVEPVFDLFEASLEILDWRAIVKTVKARGGRITFLFEMDPEAASQLTVLAMRDSEHALIEGSYFFQHHSLSGADAIARRIAQSQGAILDYNGWLDDELLHFRNHLGNCCQGEWHAVGERSSIVTECPAYIVGSGPSLETVIDDLKENQGNIVIFSCGSALRALLDSGIRPDFHVELENVSHVTEVLSRTACDFDLSGITLLASTTVDPAASNYFTRTAFFHRDSDAVIHLLSGSHHQFQLSGRSVTNSAVALAHAFGFCEVVLCGADFGAVSAKKHHSKGTLYHEAKGYLRSHLGEGSAARAFRHKIKGNLRDAVYTNDTFSFMCKGLGDLLHVLSRKTPDFKVYNASDGAFIANTIPLAPDNLFFGQGGQSKERIRENIEAGFLIQSDRNDLNRTIEQLADAFAKWYRQVSDFLATKNAELEQKTKAADRSVRDLLTGFAPFLINDWDKANGKRGHDDVVKNALTGTVMQALHICHHHCLRIDGQGQWRLRRAALLSLEALIRETGVRVVVRLLEAGCDLDVDQWPDFCADAVRTRQEALRWLRDPDAVLKETDFRLDGVAFRQAWPNVVEGYPPQQVREGIERLLADCRDNEMVLLAVLEHNADLTAIRRVGAGLRIDPDQEERMEIVRRVLSRLEKIDCKHPATASLCWQVAFWDGDYQAAVDWTLREIEMRPEPGMAAWGLAKALMLGGALDDALSIFRGICTTAPSSPMLECYASLAEYVTGNERLAVANWLGCLEESPGLEIAQAFLDGARDMPDWAHHKEHGDYEMYQLGRRLFDAAVANNTTQ